VGYKPVVSDHNLTRPVLINDLALRAHQNSSERAGNLRQASSSYEARCQRRIATSAYRMGIHRRLQAVSWICVFRAVSRALQSEE
jgi:hypothetical protein